MINFNLSFILLLYLLCLKYKKNLLSLLTFVIRGFKEQKEKWGFCPLTFQQSSEEMTNEIVYILLDVMCHGIHYRFYLFAVSQGATVVYIKHSCKPCCYLYYMPCGN